MKINIKQKEDTITLSFIKHKTTQFVSLTYEQVQELKELLQEIRYEEEAE